jgi:hypothetical protein
MSLKTNLIAYYSMADGTDDHSTHDGTATNVTFGSGGLIGSKGAFNGGTSKIDLPTSVGRPTSGSISVWVKPSAWTYAGIVIQSSATNSHLLGIFGRENSPYNMQVFVSDGVSYFQHDFGGTNIPWISTNYPSGSWTHIVATWDGSYVRLYRNGTEASDSPIAQGAAVAGTTEPFGIGYIPGQNLYYLNGSIDEVGIWSRAITSSEITELYNSGAGLAYSGFEPNSYDPNSLQPGAKIYSPIRY